MNRYAYQPSIIARPAQKRPTPLPILPYSFYYPNLISDCVKLYRPLNLSPKFTEKIACLWPLRRMIKNILQQFKTSERTNRLWCEAPRERIAWACFRYFRIDSCPVVLSSALLVIIAILRIDTAVFTRRWASPRDTGAFMFTANAWWRTSYTASKHLHTHTHTQPMHAHSDTLVHTRRQNTREYFSHDHLVTVVLTSKTLTGRHTHQTHRVRYQPFSF